MPQKTMDALFDWAPDGLSDCLLRAARLALDHQEGIASSCKPDGTLVTPADTAIEALIEQFLGSRRPSDLVMGEETIAQKDPVYLERAMAGNTWVIDPVDGTVLYAMRMHGWGISLGYMEQAVLRHGVVVYPSRTGSGDHFEFMYTSGADEVRLAELRLATGAAIGPDCLRELARTAKAVRQLPPIEGFPGLFAVSQRVAKQFQYRGPHPLVSLGSCVSTFRHLMDGGVVAYLVKLKLWDAAAVLPMAWRLGLRACLIDGREIDLNVGRLGWVTDPVSPQFLALTDNVLFYRSDRTGPALLADFDRPGDMLPSR